MPEPTITQFTAVSSFRKDVTAYVLVLKVDHRGDLATCLSALEMLRELLPAAHITLVVSSWNEKFARELKSVDTVLTYDFFGEDHRPLASIPSLTFAQAFDLALDLRFDQDTRFLLKDVPARIKGGFSRMFENSFLDIKLDFPEFHPTSKQIALRHIDYFNTSSKGVYSDRGKTFLRAAAQVEFSATSLLSKEGPGAPQSHELVLALCSTSLLPLHLKVTVSILEEGSKTQIGSFRLHQAIPFLECCHSLRLDLPPLAREAFVFQILVEGLSGRGFLRLHDLPWFDPTGSAALFFEKSLLHRSEQYAALVGACVQRLKRGALAVKSWPG